MSRASKDRASRLREFMDWHQEYKETGNDKARRKRHKALFNGSPEDTKRAAEVLAREASDEGADRHDRLRKNKFSGWTKKKE